MKNGYRYNRNRSLKAQIRRKKRIILFIIIVALGISLNSIIKLEFLAKDKEVQVFATNGTVDLKQESGSNNLKQKNNTNNRKESDKNNSNSNVEAVEFIEKYLNQQFKGQKPDSDGKKVVYLTFDDGPSETVTPSILNILKDENVHATFFVLGKLIDQSETNKKLVKREVAEGNTIGNHTYSHDYNYLYPKGSVNVDNFMEDINKTNVLLKKVLGQDFSTRVIRFPGGHMSWKNVDGIDQKLKEKDYHYVDWNALSEDAEGPRKNAEQLTKEVKKSVGSREKVVLLMHDTYGKEETAKALPEIIEYLKNKGYQFKTLK